MSDSAGTGRGGEGRHSQPSCLTRLHSPGGNAGIAAAYSARRLGLPATVVLPEVTSHQVVRRLQGEGAEVQLVGKVGAREGGTGRGGLSPWGPCPLFLRGTVTRPTLLSGRDS